MGIIFLLAAAILWGLIGPVSKYIFAQGMSPLESAFWRGCVAGLMYGIHWSIKRYPAPRRLRDLGWLILFGIVGVAGLEASYVYAVHFGGAALASILLYSAPIWVNLFSFFFLKETIPKRRWLALAVAFMGVAGVCLSNSRINLSVSALIWGLCSGFSYALFYLAGKYFFKQYQPVVVFSIAFPIGSIAILPVIIYLKGLAGNDWLTGIFQVTPNAVFACLFLGIASTYVPYLLYAAGLQRTDASRASIITMFEPIVSVVISALVWGEWLTVSGYIFAAIVLLGLSFS